MKKSILFLLFFIFLMTSYADGSNNYYIKGAPRLQRVSARYNSRKGIGLQDHGYSTMEYFLAAQNTFKSLGFLDLRGHIFDDGKWAFNAGLGLRSRLDKFPIVFGVNSFYDYRRNNSHNFYQVGVGVEFLGEVFRFRMNGYIPLGNKQVFRGVKFSNFEKNQMIVERSVRLSMYGADAELEAKSCKYGFLDAFIAAGPYYYQGDFGKTSFGGKGRFGIGICDIFHAAIKGSYDNLFNLKVQAELRLSINFGRKVKSSKKSYSTYQCCQKEKILMSRLVAPIERQEIVILSNQSEKKIATDNNGSALFFLFVNNASLAGNIGTFENPYLTLAQAENNSFVGDYIYVFPGDETSSGMDNGFVLKENQSLFGSTINQVVGTNLGNVIIPFQSEGQRPLINNSSGAGITLANQSTVSGFRIEGASSHGIIALNPTKGSSILNNDIIDSATGNNGIFIDVLAGTSVGGDFEIKNNLITSNNGSHNGILIDLGGVGTTSVGVNIDSNIIRNNSSDGIFITNSSGSGTKSFTGQIVNNQINDNSSQGIDFSQGAGSIVLSLKIDSNRFISNGSEALQNTDASGNLILSNNIVQENGGTAGIEIDLNNSSRLFIDVINNLFASNSATPGFAIDTNSSSFASMLFFGNVATGGDTFNFSEDGSSILQVDLGPNQGPLTGDNFTLVN